MKIIRILSAITIALACVADAKAADSLQVPKTTRQLVYVMGANGHQHFELQTAPVPSIGDNEVLLHVHAAALNRGDLDNLNLVLPELPSKPGSASARDARLTGEDAAGEIVRVGRLVQSFHPGQKVVSLAFANYVDSPLTAEKMNLIHGWTANGVYGDYVVIEETGIAPMPEWLSYEEASTLPSSMLTAWAATLARGYVRKGDIVVVEGTGGVSICILQLANSVGARVIVTSSSDDKLKKAKELGAWELINYKKEPNWSERVLELTDGRGADVVMDMGGRATLEQSMKAVAFEGTVAIIGGLGGYEGNVSSWQLLTKGVRAQGVIAGSRADFLRMSKYLEQHKIRPVIERTYAFDDWQKAFADLDSGNFVGKLVMRL
jgi:NADPH:quinone reductase-like Zn-dependent oxidoreductase